MKLGFLGFGNLARSVAGGIVGQGIIPAGSICVCDKSEASREYAEANGFMTAPDSAALFAACDTLFVAIKPKIFREIHDELAALDVTGKRIISPMCGVHLDELSGTFACPVMRIMPTLASKGGRDIIGYTGGVEFGDFAAVLSGIGDAIEMPEEKLDRLTVTASCGLGFAAHILEAYKNECIAFGFSPAESESITRRMFGFAVSGEESFSSLEDRVATKGGATEAGNIAMDSGLRAALSAAFAAAGEKALPKK